ncbi:XAC2610-related protein [Pseudomonas sp. B21-053]|uniref:XAC2610-related protein n=1 Tax=Pseudomonas sp. B21-053 TaxID=2895493 RepID=UPI00223084EB|nr:hypothetical protein [Pseudomonas sp. B21-053]UZE14519.1 hypothetical protein LOY68_13250 [Pseudomonas sp. B21-053]
MLTPRLLAVACLLASTGVNAEPLTFHLTDPAHKYAIEVVFAQPPAKSYEGAPAQITLRDKTGGQVLQRIDSPEGFVTYKPGSQMMEINQAPLYGEQSLLFFDDFNFDGQQDLAVRNGSEGGYGGPSYDIYLSAPGSPTLVFAPAFSDLTRDGQLGMFGVDPVAKRLHTSSKSGCCWHQFATWQIEKNEPVMVAEKIEAMQTPTQANPYMPAGYLDVTERELKDGQWIEHQTLAGPYAEPPLTFRGTLNDKIAFELWWQIQGEVYIGEVRYGKSGSGKPIRLVGDSVYGRGVLLHELDDDGQITGDWSLKDEPDEQGNYTGTWRSAKREFNAKMRLAEFKIAPQKLEGVANNQREGEYRLTNFEARLISELSVKILPRIDNGPETADIRLDYTQLKDPPSEIHYQSTLQAGNLAIVLDAQGGPVLRLQLFNGAAVVTGYGEYLKYGGNYVKIR